MEEAKAKLDAPVTAYDRFASELAGHVQEPLGRAKIRNVLPDFVQSITVDLQAKTYHVTLKGAKMPVTVSLNKNGGPYFSPSPAWVLGQPIADGQNVI